MSSAQFHFCCFVVQVGTVNQPMATPAVPVTTTTTTTTTSTPSPAASAAVNHIQFAPSHVTFDLMQTVVISIGAGDCTGSTTAHVATALGTDHPPPPPAVTALITTTSSSGSGDVKSPPPGAVAVGSVGPVPASVDSKDTGRTLFSGRSDPSGVVLSETDTKTIALEPVASVPVLTAASPIAVTQNPIITSASPEPVTVTDSTQTGGWNPQAYSHLYPRYRPAHITARAQSIAVPRWNSHVVSVPLTPNSHSVRAQCYKDGSRGFSRSLSPMQHYRSMPPLPLALSPTSLPLLPEPLQPRVLQLLAAVASVAQPTTTDNGNNKSIGSGGSGGSGGGGSSPAAAASDSLSVGLSALTNRLHAYELRNSLRIGTRTELVTELTNVFGALLSIHSQSDTGTGTGTGTGRAISMPTPLIDLIASYTAGLLDDRMYFFGGCGRLYPVRGGAGDDPNFVNPNARAAGEKWRSDVFIADSYPFAASRRATYFDASRFTFHELAPMTERRSGATAAVLADGKIYVCGGTDGLVVHRCMEAYDPRTNVWSGVDTQPRMNQTRSHAAYCLSDDGTGNSTNGGQTTQWLVVAGGHRAAEPISYHVTPDHDGCKEPKPRRLHTDHYHACQCAATTTTGKSLLQSLYTRDSALEEISAVFRANIDASGGSLPSGKLTVRDAVDSMYTEQTNVAIAAITGSSLMNNSRATALQSTTNGGTLRTVEAYDLRLKRWIDLPALNLPRVNASACALNGQVYVMGGECRTPVVEMPPHAVLRIHCTMEVLDLTTLNDSKSSFGESEKEGDRQSRWRIVALPERITGAGAAVVDGEIWIMGGRCAGRHSMDRTSLPLPRKHEPTIDDTSARVWCYTPAARDGSAIGRWTSVTAMNHTRYQHAVGVSARDGTVYAFGGSCLDGGILRRKNVSAYDTLEYFGVVSGNWSVTTAIPCLVNGDGAAPTGTGTGYSGYSDASGTAIGRPSNRFGSYLGGRSCMALVAE